MKELLKKIPKVDKILGSLEFAAILTKYKQDIIVKIIQDFLSNLRKEILNGKVKDVDPQSVTVKIAAEINSIFTPFIRSAVNGTGVVLNTGLGRAPFSPRAIVNLQSIVEGYSTLEVDVKSGKRGRREDKIDQLVALLTGAEAATVVNNNAAAVMICLNTIAENRDVIISRGEQVEIGGAFRMPDVIEKSGGNMIEVGTTNKTHFFDYADAIGDNCGAIIKVHTSNYKVQGFTSEVELKEIADLGKKEGIATYYDLGGGIVDSFENYGLPYEPLVQDAIKSGFDIVSFSGDKVLGGPQCGIIAGSREYIEKIKRNPLMRVLRIDKMRLALLEETLKIFMEKDRILKDHQTLIMLSADRKHQRKKAVKLKKKLVNVVPEKWQIKIENIVDQAGSGTLPTETIDGAAISILPNLLSVSRFGKLMRIISEIPVFGYIKEDKYYISTRALLDKDYDIIVANISKIVETLK